MIKKIVMLFLLFMALAGFQAQARISAYEFDTPEQEDSYNDLINELRCLVCQNQTIADSNAELAQDLKRKTYEMVMQGKSKKEVASFMTERYGDFVLYRPPVTTTTFLLWIGPFLIMLIGLYFLIKAIRSKNKETSSVLSEEEKARARDLLNKD